ncbi:MAG: MFS transporter [Clostridia bacterium]|nr:MFS transporter [Clostridia bacterium]
MEILKYKRTKRACYFTYLAMSSVFSLPPLLFATFREMYGISYTLLGTLVLINFCTQLSIDLIFSFFSKYFNVHKTIRIMPLLTSAGLCTYALIPTLMPEHAYIGLVIGTLLFSVAAGLSEVLLSPVIAAIPSDNPQRDMSLLHSLYAFGTFTMIVVSTVFLKVFGTENWAYLIMILACLPVMASVLFMLSPMPEMNNDQSEGRSSEDTRKRAIGLLLFTLCIFFGSCSENAMGNWISTYMENALGIPKALGDVLGAAMFAVLLGLSRIAYARFGKNIARVLLLGMIGAFICYLVAGLSSNVIVAFFACVMTGFCTSMLWPGTLIMMDEKINGAGVAAFALMAAGGDLGASVAPQLLGAIIDKVSASEYAAELSQALNVSTDQIGLKAGMLVTSLFPFMGIMIVLVLIRFFKKKQ